MQRLERRKARKEKKKIILNQLMQKIDEDMGVIQNKIVIQEKKNQIQEDGASEENKSEMELEKGDIVDRINFEDQELLNQVDQK